MLMLGTILLEWRGLTRFAHTSCCNRNCMLLTLVVMGPAQDQSWIVESDNLDLEVL